MGQLFSGHDELGLYHESRRRREEKADKDFGAMLQNAHQATMQRFDPKSKGRALDIIKPMLKNDFVPKLSYQMVDPKGTKCSLGETDAGKVVTDNLEKLLKAQGKIDEL